MMANIIKEIGSIKDAREVTSGQVLTFGKTHRSTKVP